jgi:uncharacterized membrane protein YdjX (TVP38/TMEM64 family)
MGALYQLSHEPAILRFQIRLAKYCLLGKQAVSGMIEGHMIAKWWNDLGRYRAWAILVAYILFMVVLALVTTHYLDKEALKAIVEHYGLWGVLLFGVLQYIYIVFVPVYNTPVLLASGYIFGSVEGWIINFITTTLGLFTIIFLVKRFGRPLIKKIVPQPVLDRYDHLIEKIGPLTLFTIYVLPIFPDDEVTYLVAAADHIDFRRYILPVVLGNITKASVSLLGGGGLKAFGLATWTRVIVFVVGYILIGIQEYYVNKATKLVKP